MKTGRLPNWGLCTCFDDDVQLFSPYNDSELDSYYWAYGSDYADQSEFISSKQIDAVHHDFTPLRQTIVLFMAAMSGEL